MIGELIATLAREGFERFSWDRQREVMEKHLLAEKGRVMEYDGAKAYRAGLGAALAAAGPGGYVANGWCAAPGATEPSFEALGAVDCFAAVDDAATSRPSFELGAIAARRAGQQNGIFASMDPGCVFVGEDLTIGEARSWASLVSLQGLPFMVGDRISALKEDRIEVLRRTLGSIPARSIYSPNEIRNPREVHLWREAAGRPRS